MEFRPLPVLVRSRLTSETHCRSGSIRGIAPAVILYVLHSCVMELVSAAAEILGLSPIYPIAPLPRDVEVVSDIIMEVPKRKRVPSPSKIDAR